MPSASELERIPLEYVLPPDLIGERVQALETYYARKERNPWLGLICVITGTIIALGPWQINAIAFTAWLGLSSFACLPKGWLLKAGIACLVLTLVIVCAQPKPKKQKY